MLDDEADAEDDDDEGGLRFNFEDDVAYKGPTAVVEEEDDEDDDDEDDDEQNGRAAVSCELGCWRRECRDDDDGTIHALNGSA